MILVLISVLVIVLIVLVLIIILVVFVLAIVLIVVLVFVLIVVLIVHVYPPKAMLKFNLSFCVRSILLWNLRFEIMQKIFKTKKSLQQLCRRD